MTKKIFLIAVDLREFNQDIDDFGYRKIIAVDDQEAKQISFTEFSKDYEFESFEYFKSLIHWCDEIDLTSESEVFFNSIY